MINFRQIVRIAASVPLLWGAVACSDTVFDRTEDPEALPGDRAATIEVPLRLHPEKPKVIGKPLINDIPSRAEGDNDDEEKPADPEKAAEEALHDIWVFQFDSIGNQLIAPRYYEVVSTEIRKLNIRLAEGEESRVYVLANTGDPEWAKNKDLSTIEKFVGYEYPFTEENVEMGKDEYLLMEGNVKETIRKETDLLPIDIHLTRMMAKISFKYVTAEAAKGLVVTRVIINNMPEKMRMEETPKEQNYPLGDEFVTRSVTIDKQLASGEVYTFYMPANRRGTNGNTDPGTKNDGAPEKALYVQLFVSSKSNGSNFLYTIYLGANDVNDFNVRRNHNYNITLNINSEHRDNRVLAAPANCFVLAHNDEIMFDPYTRTETGGGWKYTDYVNKKDPKKKITSVSIIWQQANVIGNNSDGSRVWLDKYDRIHVKSGTANGNALIAGYNADHEVVWSWHIWVNNDKPAELAAAVPYYTFEWSGTANGKNGKIDTAKGRVRKGRSLMTCNLGAISRERNIKRPANTFGCLYQWGRKDPFPGPWNRTHPGTSWSQTDDGNQHNYNSTFIGQLYDNAYNKIAMGSSYTGNQTSSGYMFDVAKTSATVGTVEYTIKNPTRFISPLKTLNNTSAVQNPSKAAECVDGTDGDWYFPNPNHADNLWGGTSFELAMKHNVDEASGAILSDNGATEKSIFDPCPAGWMVPPADMWLSFTIDGVNKNDGSNASYPNMNTIDNSGTNQQARGYRMCMSQVYKNQGLTDAKTVFFPSQGVRMAGGTFNQVGYCGNYHTTTGGKGGRTNAFHMHTPSFMYPFETGFGYTRRATGCSIRCVRDVDD